MGPAMRRRLVIGAAIATATFALPLPVAAHGLVGRLESPLPLAVYVAGAALAVALSFAFVILRDVRPAEARPGAVRTVPVPVVFGLRAVGLVGWLWIVAQGIVGGSSAAAVGPLFLWVYGWVGLAILSAFVGPVWAWLDPFATLFDIGSWLWRRTRFEGWPRLDHPARLAEWPAVAGLTFFVWIELVARGVPLVGVLLAYTALTLLGMAQYGKEAWRERGETFSVWFGVLGRLAPIALDGPPEDRKVRVRPFAAGLLTGRWTLSLVALAAVGTASIIFDGLSQTEPWFRVFGIPSFFLATVQLFGFLGIVVALVLAVARLVGLAAVGAGVVPIAVGYLVAHYVTFLLGDGQGIVVAISDPLQLGWDLFGTAFYEPSVAWLPPALLWTVMLGAVVGGHIVGAWAGHVAAVQQAPAQRAGKRPSQWPLAALMVMLTTVTLWSLGQAIVREPGSEAVGDVPTDPIDRAVPRQIGGQT